MRVLTTLTLSSLLCGFLALPASAQVPDSIASAPGYAEYPDQDGLMVRQMIRVTLDAAGKVEHHEETALKLLSGHLTRQGYLDPRVEWNETRSEMRIDQARTYMRDGTALDVKANSLVPNTADEMQWAVPYANQREMTIAHIGVEHDATSVLAYTITDRAPAGVPLWGVLDLQDFIPILDQWVTIQVPEGTTLHYAGIDCTVKAKLDTKDGLASYTRVWSGWPSPPRRTGTSCASTWRRVWTRRWPWTPPCRRRQTRSSKRAPCPPNRWP